MKESIEKLLKKMKYDKDFAEKILTQTEREKVIELAGTERIELTPEDIDETNDIIRRALELHQTEGELSEEELENVAGGTLHIATFLVFLTGLGFTATITTVAMTSASAVTASVISTIAKSE